MTMTDNTKIAQYLLMTNKPLVSLAFLLILTLLSMILTALALQWMAMLFNVGMLTFIANVFTICIPFVYFYSVYKLLNAYKIVIANQ